MFPRTPNCTACWSPCAIKISLTHQSECDTLGTDVCTVYRPPLSLDPVPVSCSLSLLSQSFPVSVVSLPLLTPCLISLPLRSHCLLSPCLCCLVLIVWCLLASAVSVFPGQCCPTTTPDFLYLLYPQIFGLIACCLLTSVVSLVHLSPCLCCIPASFVSMSFCLDPCRLYSFSLLMLSLCCTVSVCPCLCVSLFLCLPVCVYLCFCVFLFVCTVSLFLCLPACVYLCFFVSLLVCISVSVSLCRVFLDAPWLVSFVPLSLPSHSF